MSSIYKRKRNGKEDGYVMYSTYAFDPLKNKKRYYNITIGKLGPTLSDRYGAGIMIKHIDIKILAWYYALRTRELKQSSMEVHRRIIDAFFEWTKN